MMPIEKLAMRRVDKAWGRHRLGLGFADPGPDEAPVGEIWFEASGDADPALLVKYLFTSEKLSVQVHPDDDQARARGHARGKEECWLILNAEPDAAIGIGLKADMDADALREAACDGRIEAMLDWKRVAAGDFFYLPAGTVHAIGAGVTLVEVQQNVDLTYRLFDYGRPRDLHLDDAVAVAYRGPWRPPGAPREIGDGRLILAEGRKLVLERWRGHCGGRLAPAQDRPLWLVPIEGQGLLGGKAIAAGEVWFADEPAPIDFGGDLLVAYPGSDPAGVLTG